MAQLGMMSVFRIKCGWNRRSRCVHAVTDVTGFGLLGHALEMARGSNVALTIRFGDLPFLGEAEQLAQRNFVTGASIRNWASYAESVNLHAGVAEWRRHLLTDPQTSGGLLVACHRDRAAEVAKLITDSGYPHARIIGHASSGRPAITIE